MTVVLLYGAPLRCEKVALWLKSTQKCKPPYRLTTFSKKWKIIPIGNHANYLQVSRRRSAQTRSPPKNRLCFNLFGPLVLRMHPPTRRDFALTTLTAFSPCNLELWPMRFTVEYVLDSVKINHLA